MKLDYDSMDPYTYSNRKNVQYREKYLYDHWHPILLNLIKKNVRGKKVVDLGCGVGQYTAFIQEIADDVIGVDCSGRHLDFASSHHKVKKTLKADAVNTKLPDKSFDLIFIIGLFEYVSHKKLMKEIKRLLRDNGKIIVGIPNYYSSHRFFSRLLCKLFKWSYYPKDIKPSNFLFFLKQENFKVKKIISNDGLVYLPNFLDQIFGRFVYPSIGYLIKKLNIKNPLSNMVVVIAELVNNKSK